MHHILRTNQAYSHRYLDILQRYLRNLNITAASPDISIMTISLDVATSLKNVGLLFSQ